MKIDNLKSERSLFSPGWRMGRQLFVAMSATMMLVACGAENSAPPPATTPPAAVAEKPAADKAPETLSMGGAKSVMTFFVTSKGPGKGGDLGGLAGADRHCQALADAEKAGDHTWRAYLSTSSGPNGPAVNARDRIGRGPWYNAEGTLI